MIENNNSFTAGLSLRPAATADRSFLQMLYQSSRPDLQWIDGDSDLRERIIEQQYRTLEIGAGDHYPNAMHFIIEKAATRIGGIIVDFGHSEVRIVYLAFVPAARGHRYAREILRGIQQAAERVRSPLVAVVWRNNPRAKRVYLDLGFRVDEAQLIAERLVWYPRAI